MLRSISRNIIFLIFFTIGIYANPAYSAEKLESLSSQRFEEINNLLVNQKYFDERRKTENTMFNLMYYAISNDGNYSSFSICDIGKGSRYECVDYFEKFLTQKGCERISNQKCTVLVAYEKLIINNKETKLDKIIDSNDLNKEFQHANIKIEKNNTNQIKPLVIYTKLFNFDLDE